MKNPLRLVILIGLAVATWAGADEGQEHARQLKEAGDILPLETIVQRAQDQHPGRLLEVELEKEKGRYIYEVELVDADGMVWELKFDARSGELIKSKKER